MPPFLEEMWTMRGCSGIRMHEHVVTEHLFVMQHPELVERLAIINTPVWLMALVQKKSTALRGDSDRLARPRIRRAGVDGQAQPVFS